MALATQCPHCHTTFRVAHDQLKLRSGLVRCGACKQIFNGIEHLVSPNAAETAPPQPAIDRTAAPTESDPAALPPKSTPSSVDFVALDDEPAPAAADQTTMQPADDEAARPEQAPSISTEEDPLQRITLIDFTPMDAWEDDEQKEPSLAPATAELDLSIATPTLPAAMPASAPPVDSAAPAAGAPQAPESEAAHADGEPTRLAATAEVAPSAVSEEAAMKEAEAEYEASADEDADQEILEAPQAAGGEEDEPSFVITARKRQRRQRAMRIFMATGSLLLLAALVLQGAYVFRHQLAARLPAAKPALGQLCIFAGCELELPAQIDMVSIESSELQAVAAGENTFMLTLLLRNRSAITQAWPDIELTLNDTNENPLVRRVLMPQDYLPSRQAIKKGFAGNSEQPVKLRFELAQLKASGYRVYLFYP